MAALGLRKGGGLVYWNGKWVAGEMPESNRGDMQQEFPNFRAIE